MPCLFVLVLFPLVPVPLFVFVLDFTHHEPSTSSMLGSVLSIVNPLPVIVTTTVTTSPVRVSMTSTVAGLFPLSTFTSVV